MQPPHRQGRHRETLEGLEDVDGVPRPAADGALGVVADQDPAGLAHRVLPRPVGVHELGELPVDDREAVGAPHGARMVRAQVVLVQVDETEVGAQLLDHGGPVIPRPIVVDAEATEQPLLAETRHGHEVPQVAVARTAHGQIRLKARKPGDQPGQRRPVQAAPAGDGEVHVAADEARRLEPLEDRGRRHAQVGAVQVDEDVAQDPRQGAPDEALVRGPVVDVAVLLAVVPHDPADAVDARHDPGHQGAERARGDGRKGRDALQIEQPRRREKGKGGQAVALLLEQPWMPAVDHDQVQRAVVSHGGCLAARRAVKGSDAA
ncbi:hypothetical protein D3C86_1018830 [compost metagenome]